MENVDREVLLRVEHLSQYFKMGPQSDLKAVDDVSFNIYRGEVFGLVGESGCGKTTTGRTIMKLYDATGGNVYFKNERIVAGHELYRRKIKKLKQERVSLKNGSYAKEGNKYADIKDKNLVQKEIERLDKEIFELENKYYLAKYDHKYCDYKHQANLTLQLKQELAAKLSTVKKPVEREKISKEYADKIRIAHNERLVNDIQMIFQDPVASLDPRMTVRDIIAEGLIIKGIKDKEYIDNAVYDALEKVGLVREHAGRYPHEFSGGQRQRIGIARAMIMRPELIVADEPISALDVSIQAQVINLLNDLRKELGLTILFIAHDLSVVKYFSDRIGVMYYGKMVEMASSDELFAHPTHPYTKSLLSAIPLPDPIHERTRVRVGYNPLLVHDYTVNKPSFRELAPGHMVMANDEEFEKYKKEYEEVNKKNAK